MLQLAAVVLLAGMIRLALSWDLDGQPLPQPLATALAQSGLQPPPDKAVLVQVWATWCGICALEQSTMERLSNKLPVLSIAMQSGDRNEVSQYLASKEVSYPFMVDPEGQLSGALNVRGVPTSFIIGPDRLLHLRESGYTSYLGYRMRLWAAEFLHGR